MRRNSLRLKGYVQYHTIIWHPEEKQWYAWYDVTDEMKSVQEELNEAQGDNE